MNKVNSTYITSNTSGYPISRVETDNGQTTAFKDSQFFPAKDGSWLMVDWITPSNGFWSWYVVECEK